jgi:uncharacterized membrane protein
MHMTWLQRYKLHNFLKSSIWLVPMLSGMFAVICHRLVWKFDLWTQWQLLGYSQASAGAIVGAISTAMLTFIVFLMSMIFVALQIAVGQLTPRIIAFAFRNRLIKVSLGIFTFTYMFSVSALGRLENPVPELVVLLTIIFSAISIVVFLYFVDTMGKLLRPISICEGLAEEGTKVIEAIYPVMLSKEKHTEPKSLVSEWGIAACTINHEAKSGIIMAFDADGLAKIAARKDLMIKMIPQVGDFVTNGDPLFNIYGGCLKHDDLRLHVVFGAERTVEQDPCFVFRIIVDIAIKALSPAINDPTTAVACIDQLHRLLRRVGQRDLGDGKIRDGYGSVRVIFPTPDWEDYVRLAVSEILHYGADSIQIARRLRAMLKDLLEHLPKQRSPEIMAHVDMLDRSVARTFIDSFEKELAMSGDYKGLGGARQEP